MCPAGLKRHAQQRVVGQRRSTAKCVTASCGSSVSVEMRVRTRLSRPNGASIVPRRAGGRPATSARYSRVISRARNAACSAACTRSERAKTSSPDVSRSNRWTTPGRSGGPPATRPASAWTSVPAHGPTPGCTTTPAGLSITSRSSSSYAIRNSAGGTSATGSAGGSSTSTPRPRRARTASARHAVDPHQPGIDQPLSLRARAHDAGQVDVQPLPRGPRDFISRARTPTRASARRT